ncbi:MAG: VWA domain-containing protein [Acidobacteriota bacterium]
MPRQVHVSAFLLSLLLIPRIAHAADSWLDEVAPLIGAAERETFLKLSGSAERERFVQRFWQVRDPFPRTQRNELQENWAERLAEARTRWGSLDDERAQALLLRGEPDSTFEASCPGVAEGGRVEVWTYEPGFGEKSRMALVFLRAANASEGPTRIWRPGPGSPDLRPAAPADCWNGGRLAETMKWVRSVGEEQYRAMIEKALARPRPEPRDWYAQPEPAAPEPAVAESPIAPVTPLPVATPAVRLVRPRGLLFGETRFEARVDGPEGSVRKVAFLLEGRPIYTRTRPPYEVTLDLGSVPRLQKLAVEGLDDQGRVVARDELILNSGSQRFSVRLLDPRPGQGHRDGLRARVQVEAPPGERVERVELWLGDARAAVLYQPPYEQPIPLSKDRETGYVRAVAYLRDGRAAEDTVLLNTPEKPDEMAVRLVDLFATVVDGGGRPLPGVEPGLFSVLEDGVPQRLRIVEPAGQAPIRVVTLIDNSLSMRDSLEEARAAALGFLRRTLRPTDQAAVITFNRSPRVAVRLTCDLEELEEGFIGLLAEDQTSLYDSLAYSLQYLSGVKGQRAVLLLSDGMDRTSRLSYDQALEVARRTGIAVYAIGLGLEDGGRGEAGKKLARIAAETGGRSWFVAGTASLDGVYAQIERELRAQYHLAYQSTNNSPDTGFRAVKVRLAGKGLEARTISGYYP